MDTPVPVVSKITAVSEPSEPHTPDREHQNSSERSLSPVGTLLQKKKRERLLLVSFRMPQSLKEKLEQAAKTHEINQTDLINEAIEMNLRRYL
ncbi:MAG: ribbon-helix-helix domain-containing protein [Janthinobacterium lividum]